MSNLVKIDSPTTNSNHRREVYEEIYVQIVSVQETYHNLTRELIKKISSAIPKTKEEVNLLLSAEKQVDISNDHISSLEDLKYLCSIAVLTDGGLITDPELVRAISLTDLLISVAEKEIGSSEAFIITWAKSKLELFEKVKDLLLQILDHKLKRKLALGETELH